MKESTFLGFDYGTKRMGVAVGQSITQTATPLNPLIMKSKQLDWPNIAKYIKQWKPSGLVVGIPINMDGTKNIMTQFSKDFVVALKQKFQLPVYESDERLSTVEARQRLFDAGGYRALQVGVIDSFAAKLILETWLQMNKWEKRESI